MIQNGFLNQIAEALANIPNAELANTTVVLPNKRAKVFLIAAFQKKIEANVFLPKIVSIDDFVQEIAGIQLIDDIELIFEFYDVYQKLNIDSDIQSFDLFSNWAITLLQDFNEIDRYLIDSDKILKYLLDIDNIKKWGLTLDNQTPLTENYLNFWKELPKYYNGLYQQLITQKLGYQGMVYREATNNLYFFEFTNNYLFAGFNALNAAEELIFQHLLEIGKAKVYWDIDKVFLNDIYHDAGLFVRRFKKNWKYYKTNPLEWIDDRFSEPKVINVIGTPKSIGQAKIVGSIIDELITNNQSINSTSIVLSEEKLLIPVLTSLPASVSDMNITMGYSSKNNPVQILIAAIFKAHTNALNRSSYVFYYKDIIDIATHHLVVSIYDTSDLIHYIRTNNINFVTFEKISSISKGANLLNEIFSPWTDDPLAVLNRISNILFLFRENISNDIEVSQITKTFIFSVFKIINKLTNYFSKYPKYTSIKSLDQIYKQLISLAEVSFEGEPLKGLQLMGILETRVLDFETVIITSLNEGKFPAGKSQNSFIPYDVKREYNMPTYKEKDAIFSYHFYHLLQRAKNIFLLYNTESEGMDAGEMSRFITQLTVEKQPNHTLKHTIYNTEIPNNAYQPMVVAKCDQVYATLQYIANTRGLSPSSISSYIYNPIQFYTQNILGINDAKEVEEDIEANTLGTIIHKTLENLYIPFLNKILKVTDVEAMISKVNNEILLQFKSIYKEGEITKGKNYLAYEAAKHTVIAFLKIEIENIQSDDIVKVLFLEKQYATTFEHPTLPFPIKIKGNIDRIELRNGFIRIIDYKTGKVEKGNLKISTWEGLTQDYKNSKIIQLLIYVFLCRSEFSEYPISTGIISFKNLKEGFMPVTLADNNNKNDFIDSECMANFENELAVVILEIFDPKIAFEEKLN
jgi:hypothetical protein